MLLIERHLKIQIFGGKRPFKVGNNTKKYRNNFRLPPKFCHLFLLAAFSFSLLFRKHAAWNPPTISFFDVICFQRQSVTFYMYNEKPSIN